MDVSEEYAAEDAARERDVRLQEVINAMAREGERPHDEALEALVAAIERAGLPQMPEPWLESVADEVAQGNPYVVSAHAARETDVPQPSTEAPSETLD